jgi:hypothetical protein
MLQTRNGDMFAAAPFPPTLPPTSLLTHAQESTGSIAEINSFLRGLDEERARKAAAATVQVGDWLIHVCV